MIWGLTGSVFALVFAGLSPVMAVASLCDGRRTRRRARRRGAVEYDAAVTNLRALADEQQKLLRSDRWEHTPSAARVLATHDHAAYWPSDGVTEVSLGSGSIDGGPHLDGVESTPAHQALSLEIATLTEAPIVVDAMHGIGVVGSLPLARALARALVIQLSAVLPPTRCGLTVPAEGWDWATELPHAESPRAERELVIWEQGEPLGEPTVRASGERMLLAVATGITALPPGCETIVHVHGPDRAEIMRSAAQPRGLLFRPELVATTEAGRFAAGLQQRARASGLLPARSTLPGRVEFGLLDQQSGAAQPHGLACTIGHSAQGATSLDLVRNGPHAVVGGTTGSGKSELLVTWVLAMAATRTVSEVNFLLVDFKGGAAFSPLAALPHCVGLVTDLEAGEAARALASLTAELRQRERILRDAEARDIDDVRAPTMPRLVIVVDEFATMLDAFPALHALFVDIAARGRSLGVHLILCTQRPAGVVRDALLANCSLRISLRVNNPADSLALLGTDAAAGLSPVSPGRAYVDTGDGAAVLLQVAAASQSDIAAIVVSQSVGIPSRRPWLEPLPTQLTPELLTELIGTESDIAATSVAAISAAPTSAAPSVILGLLDEPDRQRYRVARYSPAVDGHVLVVGASGSGKTTALALIEREAVAAGLAVERAGADVERAWDLLERAHQRSSAGLGDQAAHGDIEGTAPGRTRLVLLLLDDFDSVLARWEPEHRLAALDMLAAVLRDGAAAGITCVVSVQRVANGLQLMPTLCQNRLLLRATSREDYLSVGGPAERFDPNLPPGGGVWDQRRIQLLTATECDERQSEAVPHSDALPLVPTTTLQLTTALPRNLIVVAGAPARSAERFRRSALADVVVELGGSGAASDHLEISRSATSTVFVGDADAWQGEWALLQSLRPRSTMVFDGCGLTDFRQISRRRQLPPPLAPARERVWVVGPDGHVRRASLTALIGR